MNAQEQVIRLKGQLAYANSTLESGFEFEAWELKEWKELKADLENRIAELESHIEQYKHLFV